MPSIIRNDTTYSGVPRGLLENQADEYKLTKSYAVGDYCIHKNVLYKCIATTSGEWNESAWSRTTIAGEIDSLSESIATKANKTFSPYMHSLGDKKSITSYTPENDCFMTIRLRPSSSSTCVFQMLNPSGVIILRLVSMSGSDDVRTCLLKGGVTYTVQTVGTNITSVTFFETRL